MAFPTDKCQIRGPVWQIRSERSRCMQNPEIPGSIPAPARFDLDEHRIPLHAVVYHSQLRGTR